MPVRKLNEISMWKQFEQNTIKRNNPGVLFFILETLGNYSFDLKTTNPHNFRIRFGE